MYSGDSCFDGDSILIAQQRKALKGVDGGRWKLLETEGTGRQTRKPVCVCVCLQDQRELFCALKQVCEKEKLREEEAVCVCVCLLKRECSKWDAIIRLVNPRLFS